MDTNTPITTVEQIASTLYPEPAPRPVDKPPNAEVAKLREADPARTLYKPEDQLSSSPDELVIAIDPEASAEDIEQQRVEVATLAADIGADAQDVSNLASFAKTWLQSPPTADEQAAYRRTATSELREIYGAGFDDALADARALVARDHRLHDFLHETGLGNHPAIVKRIAELARVERARGRLK